MKTKEEVIKENIKYKEIINYICKKIDKNSLTDIYNYGMDIGIDGFIYYNETHAFSMKFRKLIIELLKDTANDMGFNLIKLVESFQTFKKEKMTEQDFTELCKYISGSKCKESIITNVLAWFTVETICRMFFTE